MNKAAKRLIQALRSYEQHCTHLKRVDHSLSSALEACLTVKLQHNLSQGIVLRRKRSSQLVLGNLRMCGVPLYWKNQPRLNVFKRRICSVRAVKLTFTMIERDFTVLSAMSEPGGVGIIYDIVNNQTLVSH